MNTGKKLLMISTDRNILENGSDVRARQIEYAKNFDEVHIIVFDNIKSQNPNDKNSLHREYVISENCWAYSTGSKSKWFYTLDAGKLARFIVEKRGITDITCQDPFLTAVVGTSLKKQFPDRRLEIQIHTDISSPKYSYTFGNRIRKVMALKHIQKADHIRVVSQKMKDFVQSILPANKQVIVELRPIKVDTDWIAKAIIVEAADLHRKYPQFDKIVLMASRLEKEKNVSLAINAFAEVVKQNPKVGLIIVGSGSQLSNLQSLVSNLKLKQSVIFEPWVDKNTLVTYYKTADIFLLTSLYEGYGMTLVEAHATGCAIVSTDVGVAREVGAAIAPWNSQGLAGIIIDKLKSSHQ